MTAPSRLPPCVASGDVREVRRRAIAADGLREAEVQDLDDAVRRDLDVRGLQVAVDDPFVVRGLERLGDLPRDRQRLAQRQSCTVRGRCVDVGDRSRERLALDELENQEPDARPASSKP